jgi:hypothetical protein
MSGWKPVPVMRDDRRPQDRSEDSMIARLGRRDPYWDDGKGARRRNVRVRIESMVALGLALTACGLTAAMWLRQILPVVGIGI